jgi:hypothetical protein
MTMKIHYERTGGFAGIKMAASFDLDDLKDDDAAKLKDLLDELDFDELPEKFLPAPGARDQFTYNISLEGHNGHHHVETTDSAAPEKLRDLIQLLDHLARSQRM